MQYLSGGQCSGGALNYKINYMESTYLEGSARVVLKIIKLKKNSSTSERPPAQVLLSSHNFSTTAKHNLIFMIKLALGVCLAAPHFRVVESSTVSHGC